MNTSLSELQTFVQQTNEELQALDFEMRPLLQREREIKHLIISSHENESSSIESSEALEWMGRNCAGRDIGYRSVEHLVKTVDHDARAARRKLRDEWSWLLDPDGGQLGMLRSRRRTLQADIEAGIRAIDRIHEQARKPEERHTRSKQPSML